MPKRLASSGYGNFVVIRLTVQILRRVPHERPRRGANLLSVCHARALGRGWLDVSLTASVSANRCLWDSGNPDCFAKIEWRGSRFSLEFRSCFWSHSDDSFSDCFPEGNLWIR